ncbi:MAG: CDP-alcohol phosphatidyltransferase family protein [Acidimicrobiales bacterium]
MFDGRWRSGVEQGVKPVGSALQRTGITADHLTATGLVMAGVTAVFIGAGYLRLGVVLLALAAVPDLLDGAVAKASGTASPRGAFFDSVADRVTDALVLGGIAWHFAVTDGGLAPMLPFAVLGTSSLISYERAKAESLGYNAKGGLMERAERIIALGIGLAFPVLLMPVLWVMLALTALTAVQRFAKVWKQASAPRPVRPTVERWRAWRESVARSERYFARSGHWREGRSREGRSRRSARRGVRP